MIGSDERTSATAGCLFFVTAKEIITTKITKRRISPVTVIRDNGFRSILFIVKLYKYPAVIIRIIPIRDRFIFNI
ncbi:hypothetical protein [Morganella morganii]|uniref:hypothetical protein n=1 Tax=Morganella morganii TaxID=582 RepID=UPI0023682886|nr:hypothetical protein [Morganella morganii]